MQDGVKNDRLPKELPKRVPLPSATRTDAAAAGSNGKDTKKEPKRRPEPAREL
jgi:hypothetical protein